MEPYGRPIRGAAPPGPCRRAAYITAYGIAVKHGFRGTVEEWLESLKGTCTGDFDCCIEFGELTGNGTLYFATAYESRPYYHLHTTDPDTGAVVSDSDATVEWVMYGDYYIGITLSGLEEDATTLVVCYCSLPVEVDDTDHEHTYSVTFTWAEDYSTCMATFVCSDCGNTRTVSCTVTSETTAATTDEDGETVYTATCTLSGTEYTDSQSVTLPATGDGWTLTHEWDLTSSAVDSVTDGEATLYDCAITENGLHFTYGEQYCYLGSVWGVNHAIEIDCGEMTAHSNTSVHMRTFMIYTSGNNKDEGLVWRWQTGYWAFYHDGAWESDMGFNDRDYFSGKTVRFESDSEGYLLLYVDGELVGESTSAFANQTEVSLGSYGNSFYEAYFKAVRVYEKGSS
ncbi:MAG: hypothetical protein LUE91_02355 [Oscillospiraceae bacterium]|nr:hypothetical protein [Oscillospiraceae bacterium]